MTERKKNIVPKPSVKRKPEKIIPKPKDLDAITLFPEQLAKVNALLAKVILLPAK